MDKHTITDGHVTVTRDTATTGDLFDLVHELVGRLEKLEWAYSCSLMLTLLQAKIIEEPVDPQAYKDTIREVHDWLQRYQEDLRAVDRDRRRLQFMESPE